MLRACKVPMNRITLGGRGAGHLCLAYVLTAAVASLASPSWHNCLPYPEKNEGWVYGERRERKLLLRASGLRAIIYHSRCQCPSGAITMTHTRLGVAQSLHD